ncbi:FAD-dependent oxidoreductase [Streptomyces monticola]|uniref:FAD-dependent oxidoreductase n=1 Tax=Streptomyces monticola TaxID=2666263 RepID=A0ABW2JLT0_9ACTN
MTHQLPRRRLLAGAAAATLPLLGAAPAPAVRRRAHRPTVAVLGGGVAGLSAAHELVERGFDVTVYEHKSFGGKARSMPVPGTGSGGRADLPGEHGLRLFPGIYRNLPDTLSRIPFQGNPRGVLDNLTMGRVLLMSLSGGRDDLILPLRQAADPGALTPDLLVRILTGFALEVLHLPPHEAAFAANRVAVFLTSGNARRFGQWENTSWWEFMRAETMGADYRNIFAIVPTRNLLSMKAEVASANAIGRAIGEPLILTMLGIGYHEPYDRLLDAPTNEAWIDPWLTHLSGNGARLRLGWTVEHLNYAQTRITSATARDPGGARRTITADWYILAVPADKAAQLLNPAIVAADPQLAGVARLRTEWMAGLQFYLRRRSPIVPGHMVFPDTPWAITGVTQAQFWRGRDFSRHYGDGTVADCLSTSVGDFENPGILYGKPARDCTPRQLAHEVWAQINGALDSPIPDSARHSWHLSPGLTGLGTPHARHDEPLLVHPPGSRALRPDAASAIPNLFLAADYVRTNIDCASMEGANEAARLAVNALLERSGSGAEPCRLWSLYEPPELARLRAHDDMRYRRGLPHVFDLPEGAVA